MGKKNSRRNSAGSFTLPPGGTGGITEVCTLPDRLEMYTVDATFVIQTPDSVDPSNTNPDALWVNAKVDNVGSASQAVARTFIMASQVLKVADFEPQIDSGVVLFQMHRIKGILVICEKVAAQYTAVLQTEIHAFKATGYQLDRGGKAFERFPVLSDLDLQATTFLIHAKRVIQEVCALVHLFWIFETQCNRFDKLAKKLGEALGEDNAFVKFTKGYLARVNKIVDLRNFQEHGTATKRLQVDNFRLTQSNQIQAPVWYLDGEAPRDIAHDMNAITTFLIELAEGVFIGCVEQRLSGRLPLCFEHIEAPEPKAPVRFRLTIDTSKTKQVASSSLDAASLPTFRATN